MPPPEPPQPPPPSGALSAAMREQKMRELHDELLKLNAQLEYLRLMLKMRAPRA